MITNFKDLKKDKKLEKIFMIGWLKNYSGHIHNSYIEKIL